MRTFLTKILPLLLPLVIYLIWLRRARRNALATGAGMPVVRDAPWLWMVGAALAALAAGTVLFALSTGEEPGGVYIPPYVEDGEIVPGHIER